MTRHAWTLLIACLTTGCIPYAVGTTATTLAPGELEPTMSVYFVPDAFDLRTGYDSTSTPSSYSGMDLEARWGLDDRSDIGVRLVGGLGAVVNYKRRLTRTDTGPWNAAALFGAGVVNAGEHAHAELTLIASSQERSNVVVWYGGVRAMHVLPIARDAVRDRPTVGTFFGVRLGSAELGVSPEIGVFYDYPALGLRTHTILVVPSINLHGSRLMSIFRR